MRAPNDRPAVYNETTLHAQPNDDQSDGQGGAEKREGNTDREHDVGLLHFLLWVPRLRRHPLEVAVCAHRQQWRHARDYHEENNNGAHQCSLPPIEWSRTFYLPLQLLQSLYRIKFVCKQTIFIYDIVCMCKNVQVLATVYQMIAAILFFFCVGNFYLRLYISYPFDIYTSYLCMHARLTMSFQMTRISMTL